VANKIVVDGFDRANRRVRLPDLRWGRVTRGSSSIFPHVIYDGDYSMEIRYQLLTDTTWGSWVSVVRVPTQPLDWTGVDTVKVWVKGDGSDNSFPFPFQTSRRASVGIDERKSLDHDPLDIGDPADQRI
jgi:hypothetical protein